MRGKKADDVLKDKDMGRAERNWRVPLPSVRAKKKEQN
jgi:hypothetical protein